MFSGLISSGKYSHVEIAFMIGAAVMVIGGLAELFFGINAENQTLENIAKPLTAEDKPSDGGAVGGRGPSPAAA